jgi:hypothetical protein
MLQLFDLLDKHILLLLSNQIIQICDNVVALRCKASSTNVWDRANACPQFAWVSLQGIGCLLEYLKDKFHDHQAISGTFVRFLTRHMSDKLSIGLKSSIDALQKDVKSILSALKAGASQDSFNKLDSKLDCICRLNGLKQKE